MIIELTLKDGRRISIESSFIRSVNERANGEEGAWVTFDAGEGSLEVEVVSPYDVVVAAWKASQEVSLTFLGRRLEFKKPSQDEDTVPLPPSLRRLIPIEHECNLPPLDHDKYNLGDIYLCPVCSKSYQKFSQLDVQSKRRSLVWRPF